MANSQTTFLRKINCSTRVVKGASVPKDGKPGLGSSLEIVQSDSTKGRHVNSSVERFKTFTPNGKSRKAYSAPKSNREGVQYEVATGSVVPLVK